MKITLLFAFLIGSCLCVAQPNKANFKIVHTERDNRGLINTLDVYVPNMSTIKTINKQLFDKYKNTGIVTFQIYYYDDLIVALRYRNATFDKGITDKVLDRMSQHIIGVFEYDQYNKPTESLKIGRDAPMR